MGAEPRGGPVAHGSPQGSDIPAAPQLDDTRGAVAREPRVVELRGEIDLATAPILQAELDEALATGARAVVVDATSLDFLDARGAGVIARAADALEVEAGELRIVGAAGIVRKVLELAGLTDRVADG